MDGTQGNIDDMNSCRKKITVTGLVQGIGFRPFVAELAEALGLEGQVKNLGGIVEILISGNKQAVDTFIHRLHLVSEHGELPGCRIDSMQVEALGETDVAPEADRTRGFQIVESGSTRESRRFLPVDLPTCDRCVEELHDPSNRRFGYPFISCTACGPRFSIQRAVPYDRDTITMGAFPMCGACKEEYTQKGNIRRHAQTIACKDCGPRLTYVAVSCERKTEITEEQAALQQAIIDLTGGKIGAIKDIGGFHLACLPTDSQAAGKLREFKNRDKKPFAVMFLNLDEIREYCQVSRTEEELLLSSARPIVLLKKKKDFVPEICGESDRIGALLPCNPLQILLLEQTGPLVMTSGNRGGEPIMISDREVEPYLGRGIDFMLTHDREILTPLDDSIYQVVETAGKSHSYSQIIRRARGLVPEPILLPCKLAQDTFAAGGDLKAVFALGRKELVYMSQHFGDLEEVRCMESRTRGRAHMEQLLEINPKCTVADMHPSYVTVQEAKEEKKPGTRLLQIQHHHAHVASVIAEHGLKGKVLGIACDGTGYGTDGTIWGSEFLLCENEKMTRLGHLSGVKLLGGDASAKDADMTLLSYMLEAKKRGLKVSAYLEEKGKEASFPLQEMAWKQNINTVVSSSMGRLFDAAAALLDICHGNSYEGECAILLEQAAHRGRVSTENEHFAYNSTEKYDNILQAECRKTDGIWQLDGVKLLIDMMHLKKEYSKDTLAYFFHHALAVGMADMAEHICKEWSVTQLALSGGTFLNRILPEEFIRRLEEAGRTVYLNQKVPCGDGGIALGQMYLAAMMENIPSAEHD